MKIEKIASYVIVIAFVIALLVIGKPFLVPLFLAIVIWYVITSINEWLRTPQFVKERIPNSLSLLISSILIIGVLFLLGNVVAQNIEMMTTNAPSYRVNIQQQLQRILVYLGLEKQYDLSSMAHEFNLNDYTGRLINSITGLAQKFVLILIYVVFLLFEQHTIPRKIKALKWSDGRKRHFNKVVKQANSATKTYLAVKTGASILTAVLSFTALYFIGVDFPVFWAFLIFLLNYIPTIGSIVATFFPSVVALVQFDTLGPFFAVLIIITGLQFLIGSFLEPRLLGNSLNISPFVIILSLVLWGLIWGVVGMLLCVPLTVIIIIVLAQFPNTRGIAIMLSRNGKMGEVE